MFKKLQTKIIIIIGLILLATVGANHASINGIFNSQYYDTLKTKMFVTGETLKIQLESLLMLELPIGDLLGFDERCKAVVNKYSDISFAAVVDINGVILFHSDPAQQKKRLDIPEIRNSVESKSEMTVEFTLGSQRYYGCIVPVYYNGERPVGAVVVGVPKKIITDKVRGMTRNSGVMAISFFIISLCLVSFALYIWVTKPLMKLDAAAREISAKGTETFQGVDISSKDELGSLAESFNQMALDLRKTTVSKAYVDSIISGMIDALAVISLNRKIKTVNQAAVEMSKYSYEELMGKPVDILFPITADSIFGGWKLETLIKTGQPRSFETTFQTKYGAKVPILASCSVMKDEEGKAKYIICTVKDITEQKRSEELLRLQAEKLVRYNAELQEFAYIASHDLQEPLRKISAFGNRLKEKCGAALDAQGTDYLDRMNNAAIRMQNLISDLLTYSRVNTKAQPFKEVDLRKIAGDVVSDLEIRIEQTGGRVEIGDLPVIEAEPTQMRQLFQNLIGNGLKFHRPEVAPVIKIYSQMVENKERDSYWQPGMHYAYEITFEDNGIGIEEKYFNRIFGVFQRLHGRDEYEGTGVGLAVCQKIVERHNGSIKVESKPGEGTKFIVRLPLRQSGQERLQDE